MRLINGMTGIFCFACDLFVLAARLILLHAPSRSPLAPFAFFLDIINKSIKRFHDHTAHSKPGHFFQCRLQQIKPIHNIILYF